MKTVTFLVMLLLCLSLTATTNIVIDKIDNTTVSIPVAEIDSIYFAEGYVGDEVASIEFEPAIYVDPLPYGHPQAIYVLLYDEDGNLVYDATPVNFTFVSQPPQGVNINNEVYQPGESVSVYSSNGMATVTLHNGGEDGVAEIQASVEYDGQTIAETHCFDVLATGLHSVAIQYGNNAFDSGSGLWRLPISIIATSPAGTPLANGTAVWFTIGDTEIDWCSIVFESYIGNDNIYGDSLPGVANTTLYYDGAYSLQEVPVHVYIADFDDIFMVELPMNDPILETIPIPGYLEWNEDNNTDEHKGQIYISIIDGLGNPVQNATLMLSSTHGVFIEPEEQYQVPEHDWNYVQTDQTGVSHALIQFFEYECPPDEDPPNIVAGVVTIYLLGTDISDTVTFALFNYIDPND